MLLCSFGYTCLWHTVVLDSSHQRATSCEKSETCSGPGLILDWFLLQGQTGTVGASWFSPTATFMLFFFLQNSCLTSPLPVLESPGTFWSCLWWFHLMKRSENVLIVPSDSSVNTRVNLGCYRTTFLHTKPMIWAQLVIYVFNPVTTGEK